MATNAPIENVQCTYELKTVCKRHACPFKHKDQTDQNCSKSDKCQGAHCADIHPVHMRAVSAQTPLHAAMARVVPVSPNGETIQQKVERDLCSTYAALHIAAVDDPATEDGGTPKNPIVFHIIGKKPLVNPAFRKAERWLKSMLERTVAHVAVPMSQQEENVFRYKHGKDVIEEVQKTALMLSAPQARDALRTPAGETVTLKLVAPKAAGVVQTAAISNGPASGTILEACASNFNTLDVSVVVNPANSQLRHGGGLAQGISQAAGQAFVTECNASVKHHGPVPEGCARLTSSGNLAQTTAIKHIAHVVSPVYDPSEPNIEATLRKCIIEAVHLAGQQQGVTGIGIPAVGCGLHSWDPQQAAREIVRAVLQAADDNQLGGIRKVVFFDIEQSKATAFSKGMHELAKHKSSLQQARVAAASLACAPPVPQPPKFVWVWNYHEAWVEKNRWVLYDWDQQMQIEDAYQRGNKADFRICGDRGGNPSDSKHAPKDEQYPVYFVNLGDMMQRNAASGYRRAIERRPYREGDPLPPLFEERKREVERRRKALATRAQHAMPATRSKIATNTDGAQPQQLPEHGFVLCGPKDSVLQHAEQIKPKTKAMWKTATLKIFENDAEQHERLLRHTDVAQALNESSACASIDGNGNVTLHYLRDMHKHEVHSAMATARHSLLMPETWDVVPDTEKSETLVREVRRQSEEFNAVAATFGHGGFSKRIIKVERVQNREHWDMYFNFRATKLRHGYDANEKRLFHGTKNTDPKFIINGNFDFRMAKPGMFGKGAYFAEEMSYCHGGFVYTVKDNPKHKQVFIARVLAGNVEERGQNSDGNITRPKEACDSIRGNVTSTHSAIIVYNLSQTYPEYLVTYEA